MRERSKENPEKRQRRLNKDNQRYDNMIANETGSKKSERLASEAAKKRDLRKRKKVNIQEKENTSAIDEESDYEKLRQSNINEIKEKAKKLGLKVMFMK